MVFSGSARTCRPDGRGAPGGPRLRGSARPETLRKWVRQGIVFPSGGVTVVDTPTVPAGDAHWRAPAFVESPTLFDPVRADLRPSAGSRSTSNPSPSAPADTPTAVRVPRTGQPTKLRVEIHGLRPRSTPKQLRRDGVRVAFAPMRCLRPTPGDESRLALPTWTRPISSAGATGSVRSQRGRSKDFVGVGRQGRSHRLEI